MQKSNIIKSISIFLVCCLVSTAALACLYLFDNKYTVPAPLTQDESVTILPDFIESAEPICLVGGWELYPDMLLSSAQIDHDGHLPIKTFIGQYLSLSALHGNGSPYGRATYRLRYSYDGEPATYSLLLPEIFCAADVYQNDRLIARSGSIYPYHPHVRDINAPLVLDGDGDIVVHTANFSHYYSGMTYPPVLASPDTLSRVTGSRMLIYGFICFSSLAIALFSCAVWLIDDRSEDRLSLWFGVLSLAFSARVCYPFLRMLGVPLLGGLYALEDTASMLCIWCALNIALHLIQLETARWAGIVSRFALGMAAVGGLIPLLLLPAVPAYTPVYGLFISWYKLLSALLLVALAFRGAARGTEYSSWLIGGVAVYATGLLAGVVLIGRFEPLRGAWMEEYGSFGLVLCFSVLMALKSRAVVAENRRLTGDLREQVEKRTGEITALIDERQRLFSELLHDLKSPMASLQTYTQLIRENGVMLDDTTIGQLDAIDEKCGTVNKRLRTVQDFAANQLETHFECIDLYGLLEDFYTRNCPDVEASGPELRLKSRLVRGSCFVRGDRDNLDRMLQNLIYNAVSFTLPGGVIELSLGLAQDMAVITVSDSGCGIAPDILPRLFERFYTSRSDDGGRGLGLYIVRSIVTEHGGSISVKSQLGQGASFTVSLPLDR